MFALRREWGAPDLSGAGIRGVNFHAQPVGSLSVIGGYGPCRNLRSTCGKMPFVKPQLCNDLYYYFATSSVETLTGNI